MSSLADKADDYPQPIKGHISHKEWEKVPVCNLTEEVIKDLRDKSAVGLKKYGVTMDREDLSLLDWMRHHYSELQDALKYVKKQIIKLEQLEQDGQ